MLTHRWRRQSIAPISEHRALSPRCAIILAGGEHQTRVAESLDGGKLICRQASATETSHIDGGALSLRYSTTAIRRDEPKSRHRLIASRRRSASSNGAICVVRRVPPREARHEKSAGDLSASRHLEARNHQMAGGAAACSSYGHGREWKISKLVVGVATAQKRIAMAQSSLSVTEAAALLFLRAWPRPAEAQRPSLESKGNSFIGRHRRQAACASPWRIGAAGCRRADKAVRLAQ